MSGYRVCVFIMKYFFLYLVFRLFNGTLYQPSNLISIESCKKDIFLKYHMSLTHRFFFFFPDNGRCVCKATILYDGTPIRIFVSLFCFSSVKMEKKEKGSMSFCVDIYYMHVYPTLHEKRNFINEMT